MPPKYHIHTAAAAPRVRPVGKLGIVDWREDCSSCHNCVKRPASTAFTATSTTRFASEPGYLDYIYQCKGCLNCVQSCTKGILTRVINPEYRQIGDDVLHGRHLLSTWFQAETGRIPVSGAGYGGPFSGPGFDAMWTDMSEIVRPTRDGIHGREYISTSVDIGRKLPHLSFADGRLAETRRRWWNARCRSFSTCMPQRWRRGRSWRRWPRRRPRSAATGESAGGDPGGNFHRPAPRDSVAGQCGSRPQGAMAAAAMVMLSDSDDVAAVQAAIKRRESRADRGHPPAGQPRVRGADRGTGPRRRRSVAPGLRRPWPGTDSVSPAALAAWGGMPPSETGEGSECPPRHARDVIREVHRALVADGTRDRPRWWFPAGSPSPST